MADAIDPLVDTERRPGRTCASALICAAPFVLALAAVALPAAADEPLPQETIESIRALARSPVVVAAVRAENENGKTEDQIAILDEGWREMYQQPGFLAPWTDSPCGQLLGTTRAEHTAFTTVVALDRDGTNVALSNQVPHYWHRDESCFANAIAGQSHVQSTTGRLVEVCVPVHGTSTVPIGVLWVVVDRQLLSQQMQRSGTHRTAAIPPAAGQMVP